MVRICNEAQGIRIEIDDVPLQFVMELTLGTISFILSSHRWTAMSPLILVLLGRLIIELMASELGLCKQMTMRSFLLIATEVTF